MHKRAKCLPCQESVVGNWLRLLSKAPSDLTVHHLSTCKLLAGGCEPITCMAAASTVSFALAAAETSVHNIDMQSAHTTGVITIAW